MAELGNLGKVNSARLLLKESLEKLKQVTSSLDKTGSRLQEMSRRLTSLEAELRPTLETFRDQIDSLIVGPIAAVLRAYGTVRELDASLSSSDPSADLFGHVALSERLEEGLRFLSSNCGLASRWSEEILRPLETERFLSLKSSHRAVLDRLRDTERRARLEGGMISNAMEVLENEFSRLLIEHARPIPIRIDEACDAIPSLLPALVVQKLRTIAERSEANGRLEKCLSLFIESRASNARKSLKALDLEYLNAEIIPDGFESCVKRWGEDLEVVVKRVLGPEHELCNRVFEKIGPRKFGVACFARIAIESGILSLVGFGTRVTETKKDPMKLLRLLDVFRALNGLRADFSRIFGDPECSEIQAPTRDLVKRLVEGASGIFRELPARVALQRRFSSPPDGSVPRLVRFVTHYCDQLLGDEYRPALAEVLTIQRKWKREVNEEEEEEEEDETFLSNQFRDIMKEIGVNLDEWSKGYADISLSYLFMMNNHCHFCNLRGTKLGGVMGRSWLSEHERYKEYYAALYLRESWGNILPYLISRNGVFTIATGDFDKKRLKAFNEAFEDKYEKHSKLVISDERLRRNVCELLVQTVVPVYRSYMKSYGALVEQDSSARKYVKHSAQSLETKLSSMFQPKLIKYCSDKHARLFVRVKNVVTSRFRETLTCG